MSKKAPILLGATVAVALAALIGYVAWSSYNDPVNRAFRELKSPSASVRQQAVRDLAQLRPNDPRTIDALINALGDENAQVSDEAALALVQLGPPAVPALQKATWRQPPLSERAEATLVRMGPSVVPALLDAVKKGNRSDREKTFALLQRIGPAALPALIEAIPDGDYDFGSDVEAHLAKSGAPAIVPLSDALGHENAQVRRAAVSALARMTAHPAEVVPLLLRAVKDRDAKVRQDAARGLGKFAPDAREAVPVLVELQTDGDAWVRQRAAFALLKFDPNAKAAVLGLCDGLVCDNFYVRLEAAEALGRLGPDAKAAVPTLVAIAKTPSDGVRTEAALALARIDPNEKAGVPTLIAALAKSFPPKRWMEVHDALDGMAAQIVPELTEGLKHEDFAVREAIVGFLGKAGPAAVPALVIALRDNFNTVRCLAARCLGSLGPQAKAAVPALTDAANGQYTLPPIELGLSSKASQAQRASASLLAFQAMDRRRQEEREFQSQALAALRSIDPAAAEKVRVPIR